ncbi:hypothetical protein ACI3PL_27225, partial [Lacticaseibacillus paracasei]
PLSGSNVFPCTECQASLKLDDATACQNWANTTIGTPTNSTYCNAHNWIETDPQCIKAKLPFCPYCQP